MNVFRKLDLLETEDHYNSEPYETTSEANDNLRTGCLGQYVRLILILTFIGIIALFFGCTTTRSVEHHHHHTYEADTAAVHAQVDRQLTSWHEDMQAVVSVAVSQQLTQQQQHEHQQETITELITVSTDSVGRTIRQEQRTITRDITRELQQQEQRLTQEYEARLRVVVDSVNDTWSERFDSLASHISQMDSTFVKKTPVGDTRPWYRRLWDYLQILFFGFAPILFLYLTRRLWWPPLKRLV
jgi:hypothetical protein